MERRFFLQVCALTSAQMALVGCRREAGSTASPEDREGWERTSCVLEPMTGRELMLDGLLELPSGFAAVVLQREGESMTDGHRVGAQPDGMTCHEVDGNWVLLRNHELGLPAWFEKNEINYRWFKDDQHPAQAFDPEFFGGVSRVVVDPAVLSTALASGTGEGGTAIRSSNAILAGTDRNCAGGAIETDQVRGWVTCEESDEPGHGFAFLTLVEDATLVPAEERRLKTWGRFKREAIAVDPNTGIAYMTEDHPSGLFYRHVPRRADAPLGPGTLYALSIEGLGHTDPHLVAEQAGAGPDDVEAFVEGTEFSVSWVLIDDPNAVDLPCRTQGAQAGATAFNRCEGLTFDATTGLAYFIASTAGPLGAGQIFRHRPTDDTLLLLTQVQDRTVLSMPDNVTVAPWGDLVMAEDNYDRHGGATSQFIRGMTPEGRVYDIARNARNTLPGEAKSPDISELPPGAEFTGVCFSPDGSTLFVNMQAPENVTLAIRGDWARLRST